MKTSAETARSDLMNTHSGFMAIGCRIVGLSILVGIAVVTIVIHNLDPNPVVITYFIANLFLMAACIWDKDSGALAVVVRFYFCFFTALPAVVQIDAQAFPFASTYTKQELIQGMNLLAIAQISLEAGALWKRGNGQLGADSVDHNVMISFDRKSSRHILLWALALAAISLVLMLIAGPRLFFTARFDETVPAVVEGFGAQVAFVARSISLVAGLLPIIVYRYGSRSYWRISSTAIMLLCGLVAVTINFPTSLPRFLLLGALLALFAVVVPLRRASLKAAFILGAGFFMLYVLPVIKDLRTSFTFQTLKEVSVRKYLLTGDFDSFKQIVDTAIYYQADSFRHFDSLVGVVLFWIPRSWWPGKPVHTGELTSSGLGYPYTNVSSPLPAEAFAGWGMVAVVLVMFATGRLINVSERMHYVATNVSFSPNRIVLYALLVGYSTILLRGSLNAVAPMVMTAFITALIGILVTEKNQRFRKNIR